MVFASDGDRMLRAWGRPERPWVVGVEPGRSRWAVTAWGAGATEARRAARDLFSLDQPLEEFYRLVRREPVLRGTERTFRGLRVPRDPTVYESLLHAVIGQQLSVRAALSIQRRLFDRAGSFLSADGVEVPCVPPPGRILTLGPDGLRATGLSRAKVAAILGVAGRPGLRVAGDPALATDPLDGAIARLVSLRGVGRWTAENCLLRGTGRRDVFVAGDLGIRVALDRYGVVPRTAGEEVARAWAERWYPGWGSYATLYLWRKLVAGRRVAAG